LGDIHGLLVPRGCVIDRHGSEISEARRRSVELG
jgi:hypothetical protein